MTAARIARRQSQEPPERDLIGWALFYKMDWCERHPGITLAIVGGLILLEAVFEGVFA